MRNETDRYNILGGASNISDNNGTDSETHNKVWGRAAITTVCKYFNSDSAPVYIYVSSSGIDSSHSVCFPRW
jgi:hypothetical protein